MSLLSVADCMLSCWRFFCARYRYLPNSSYLAISYGNVRGGHFFIDMYVMKYGGRAPVVGFALQVLLHGSRSFNIIVLVLNIFFEG